MSYSNSVNQDLNNKKNKTIVSQFQNINSTNTSQPDMHFNVKQQQ